MWRRTKCSPWLVKYRGWVTHAPRMRPSGSVNGAVVNILPASVYVYLGKHEKDQFLEISYTQEVPAVCLPSFFRQLFSGIKPILSFSCCGG